MLILFLLFRLQSAMAILQKSPIPSILKPRVCHIQRDKKLRPDVLSGDQSYEIYNYFFFPKFLSIIFRIKNFFLFLLINFDKFSNLRFLSE